MNRMGWCAVAICLALVGMVGCRGGGQVYQVKDAPVVTASGEALSMDQVRKEMTSPPASLCGMANGSPETRRDCRYAQCSESPSGGVDSL